MGKKSAANEKPAGAPMNKTESDYSKTEFNCTKLSKEGKPWNLKISTWNVVSLKALAKKSGLKYVEVPIQSFLFPDSLFSNILGWFP